MSLRQQIEPGPLVSAYMLLWTIPVALWPVIGAEAADQLLLAGLVWESIGFLPLMTMAALRTQDDFQSSVTGVLRHAALLIAWPVYLIMARLRACTAAGCLGTQRR